MWKLKWIVPDPTNQVFHGLKSISIQQLLQPGTTWAKSYPILTPYPTRVEKHGHDTSYYLPFNTWTTCGLSTDPLSKVIKTKYSKHWPYYTVAHTIDCVCSKMLNHGLNHGLFLSLFKLISCPIHWIVYVLAYFNFIFEFYSKFSTAQNNPLCPDT